MVLEKNQPLKHKELRKNEFFLRNNDSGCPVWNENGDVLGILYGGNDKETLAMSLGRQLESSVHFVSRVADLLADIKPRIGEDTEITHILTICPLSIGFVYGLRS